ncbi:MAG: LytTR family DNA-binding domain-containing protein [Candidatus Saccharimonadaceae bacterium]|jgi:DNA-binding LytR/AlgR family response regulator|nr:LytTR family DNA-binding domain-containing protein [Candidatus Saccharimonadaceae bacterium]
MKIAICDDNKDDLALLKEYAERYYPDAETVSFCSTDEMETAIESGESFDVYILDVLIDAFTGIDLAKLIRKYSALAPIVFVTSSKEYALDAFSVDAAQYLIKPVTYDALAAALSKIELMTFKIEHSFSVKNAEGTFVTVIPSDIIYIDYLDRRINYYLIGDGIVHSVYIRGKFTDNLAFEPTDDFVFVQSACLVNLKHVKTLNKDSVTLTSGVVIPVAISKYKEVKTKYFDFFLKGGNL